MISKEQFLMMGLVVVFLLFLGSAYLGSKAKRLNNIKSVEVGDGQHGDSRWMSEAEKDNLFVKINLPKKLIDLSDSCLPGRVLDFNPKTREMLVDTSDSHGNIKAPSGVGKTTVYLVPNIQYNMMAGVSMIIPDIKGEMKKITEADARKLGYSTYTFDFVNLIGSNTIDLFEDINEYMDEYMSTGDIIAKAQAESLAGELSTEITGSRERGSNENSFFLGASKGLIQSTILMVSMFAEKNQKHLSSVRGILQSISSMPKDKKNPQPAIVQLMNEMPNDFGPKKHMGAAFAASHETEDNIYSSALDDLRPFNDALAEQIISVPEKPGKFSYKELIDKKSIVYIVLPEDKTEFKVYGKLIIKKIIKQLGSYASTLPEKKLPKTIKVFWEEFAEYPKIDEIGSWLQLQRGKGILFDLVYQDEAMLREKYGDNIPTVLKNNCACSVILGVAPEDDVYAEKVSKILGTQTIQSGSVSVNYDIGLVFNAKSRSTTTQMISKPLMDIPEILHMEKDNIQIVLKRGQFPLKVRLMPYYSKEWGIKIEEPYEPKKANREFYKIDYMDFDKLREKLNEYAGVTSGKLADESISEAQNKKSQKEKIAKLLYMETQDKKIIDLVMNEEYNELIKYVTSHYLSISKLDLLKYINSIEK